MELNEIKKLLYKQKPEAFLNYIRKGTANYQARVFCPEETKTIVFEVPVQDMGDADFMPVMPSQLLIRWIIIN